MLRCSWGQADRDFAALERLLDTAENGRPDEGWPNSEPRFWAIRAAAEYLQAPLCVWEGDDGPGIRAASGDLRMIYRTVGRER